MKQIIFLFEHDVEMHPTWTQLGTTMGPNDLSEGTSCPTKRDKQTYENIEPPVHHTTCNHPHKAPQIAIENALLDTRANMQPKLKQFLAPSIRYS